MRLLFCFVTPPLFFISLIDFYFTYLIPDVFSQDLLSKKKLLHIVIECFSLQNLKLAFLTDSKDCECFIKNIFLGHILYQKHFLIDEIWINMLFSSVLSLAFTFKSQKLSENCISKKVKKIFLTSNFSPPNKKVACRDIIYIQHFSKYLTALLPVSWVEGLVFSLRTHC